MRENLKSGSVRGLIVTSEPILQQKVDYEPYSTRGALPIAQQRIYAPLPFGRFELRHILPMLRSGKTSYMRKTLYEKRAFDKYRSRTK